VGESACLFFIDLDRFKSVNDTLGHAAGDELIRQVADRLVATVRRQDTVARLGGDEFAVLLPGLSDPESIENMARRAIGTLNAPFTIDGHDVCTSASIGIAVTPAHGETYDDLLGKADRAMYRSKSTGRNTFHVFTDDIGHPPFDRVVPSGDGPKTGARLS
jgi:diguanylate cyclase (GGDEF)-like protein